MSLQSQSAKHIEQLESIEDDVLKLLKNAQNTVETLQELDASKEVELTSLVKDYHVLLQSIQSSLATQINECREPLLLPLLPMAHENQFISSHARAVHKKLFDPSQQTISKKDKTHKSKPATK
mmetsp:Transcript_47309/g.78504  ORF Transcript_47309/g.78504 Transcript_47309/m.78504 type:complete len:123 (+) Transcript_47309:23-391(+)